MTDREKLIALIFNGQRLCTNSLCHGCEQLADHLIANGVVVREKGEWEIRVDDYDNEYIERKTLMKQVQLMASRSSLGETKPDSLSGAEVVGLILEAPVADVVVREKGEWRNNYYEYPECTRCGYMPQEDPLVAGIYLSDFCPNCGADMRKGENDG